MIITSLKKVTKTIFMILPGHQFSLSFTPPYIKIMLVNIARLKIAIKKLSMWFSAFMSLII